MGRVEAWLFGALLTAFYMTRQVALVFFGENRGNAPVHPHESPRVMTVPLIVLAAGAVALGFLGTPAWPWLEAYLNGHELRADFGKLFEWGTLSLMLTSTVVVAIGIGIGAFIYTRKAPRTADEPDPLDRAQPALHECIGGAAGTGVEHRHVFEESGNEFLGLGVIAPGQMPGIGPCGQIVPACATGSLGIGGDD